MSAGRVVRSPLVAALVLAACGRDGGEPGSVAVGRADEEPRRHAASAPDAGVGAPALLQYLDEDILEHRVVSRPALDAAMQRISDAIEGLVGRDEVPRLPIGVFVAVKPTKRARIWIEVFHDQPGRLTTRQIERLREEVKDIAAVEVQAGPVMYGVVYHPAGSKAGTALMPPAWEAAIDRVDERLPVPDALLQVIWPDAPEPGWEEVRSEPASFRVQMPDYVKETERSWTGVQGETIREFGLRGVGRDGTVYLARCSGPYSRDLTVVEEDLVQAPSLSIERRSTARQGEGHGIELVLAAPKTGTRLVVRGLVYRGATSSTYCEQQVVPIPAGTISSERLIRFFGSFDRVDGGRP